jgi:polyisoprenoid-binding protein YceI
MKLKSLVVLAAMSFSVFGAQYEIDGAHSSAQFSVKHLMVSNVRGEFSKMTGTVQYDPKNLGATKIDAVIDVNTISTREAKRDEHLKSADFFDAAKYPTIKFVSKKAAAAGAGKLKVTGDLTIHGVTKEVVLDVEGPTAEVKDPWGGTRTGAVATTKINRKDFGLTWNKALETGGVMVGEEVQITLDVQLKKVATQVSQAK